MTGSELRAEQNIASGSSSSCPYTDGAQYGVCQTEARGWPMPQNMGGGRGRSKTARKSRRANKCRKCGKKVCAHKQSRSRSRGKARSRGRSRGRSIGRSRGRSRGRARGKARARSGGFIKQAIVPFSLFVAQKNTQSRHRHSHSRRRKNKSYRRR